MTSSASQWISSTTKRLALGIVVPVLVYIATFVICWTSYQLLKPKSGFWFDCCGHDGILPNLLLGVSVVLGLVCLLVAPASLLLDWIKWKKNSA